MKERTKYLIGLGVSLALTVSVYASDLINGVAWTGTTTPTPAKMNAIVNEATPASWIGFVLVTNNTPNITLHPRYTNFVWFDSSGGYPVSIKSYDGTNWNALGLGSGSVTEATIQSGAVTESKLGNGAVTTDKLGNNSVDANKIIAGNVNNSHLAANAVTTAGITNDAVTTAKILDGTIVSADIGSGVIAIGNMANNSVGANQLTNGAVAEIADLVDNIITNSHITTDAIRSTNIVDGTIATADIASGVLVSKFESATNSPSSTSIVDIGAGGTIVFPHGLGAKPTIIRAVLHAAGSDLGYSAGDEIDLNSVVESGNQRPLAVVFVDDADNIEVRLNSSINAVGLHKTSGAETAMTESLWFLKVYATYIP